MRTVLSLSGSSWLFRCVSPRSPWRAAVVPGCVHQDLLRHGLIKDPFLGTNELAQQWIEERDWEYKLLFNTPAALTEMEHVELCSDGLDTLASITLNGVELGWSDNMFQTHRFDVRDLLGKSKNELRIRFESARRYVSTHRLEHKAPVEFNDPVGGSTRIRKQACQFGWDWAPRLVTAGLWRGIRIEAWNGARIDDVAVVQEHSKGKVRLFIRPELTEEDAETACRVNLSLGGALVAHTESCARQIDLELRNPRLWWPAGQGDQPLYELKVELLSRDGVVLDRWVRKIGLRRIELDRSKDSWGESFRFVVNGRPVFAKGANWIPAHSFVAALGRGDYARDLQAAVAANMNCLRVWGGGVYEDGSFYDLCDELGLLVWQDFMFACSLYPSDPDFLDSVELEAEHQVLRLRHHACLALWCGNNEIPASNPQALKKAAWRRGYEKLFHKLLPEVLRDLDPITPYWPSSPWRGDYTEGYEDGAVRGDTHYWDVWHARKPVSDYTKRPFRFCSEFGMQSFASAQAMRKFSPPGDQNLFGASSENHQKNPDGNRIILDYVTRLYGYPRRPEDLIYLSQLNQAHCMQVAVEYYRRNMPRCMGALYWQLNDCWPCASWSSIEHSGRWKALHHAARRFFTPALLCAQVLGEEKQEKGNYRVSDVHGVELHTCYDAPGAAKGRLAWSLMLMTGRTLRSGSKKVMLRNGEALCQERLDLGAEFSRHSRDDLVMRISLEVGGRVVSEDGVVFATPRFLRLPIATTQTSLRMAGQRKAFVSFTSDVYQHRFCFDLKGLGFQASDNFFDLFPGIEKEVELTLDSPCRKAVLQKALHGSSLVDALHNEL